MPPTIQSDAFHRAALESERQRIIGLLIAVVALNGFSIVNGLIYHMPTSRLVMFGGFWTFCGLYELLMLWITVRAQRQGRPVNNAVWVVNTIIECLFPTIALTVFTADDSFIGPYKALLTPSLLVYCILILLSTLRLSPALSLLAGIVSMLGYVGVYVMTRWSWPDHPNRSVMPPQVFTAFPILLGSIGLIAAGIARRIRGQVIAALAEAETRRKLDRVEHDLQIARTIQMGLLPKTPPAIAGYDIAGWSQPADQTGGDYYDWIELPGGRFIFTIGDATGHGIGPALMVAACRAYFRAIASRDDPLQVITGQIDALIAADIGDGRFITAAIALLDPEKHTLSIYSAGHAPLYLYEASKDRVTAFEADQPPLGVGLASAEADTSRAKVIQLSPGDEFVLVSDGLFEAANAEGVQFGIGRLGESIRQNRNSTAADLIHRMHEQVKSHCQGVPQADDQTAVVIRRCS